MTKSALKYDCNHTYSHSGFKNPALLAITTTPKLIRTAPDTGILPN